ncbi:MAG: hypothetical protein ABW163_02265 [Luteimonas sp.]|jgi:hypothetical protein
MSDINFNFSASIAQSGIRGLGESSSEGGESWLVALAKGMGAMLGDVAEKMQAAVKKMEGAEKESKAFMEAQTEFQAQSQMFSMLSNTVATAIKSIGEGLTANARKT